METAGTRVHDPRQAIFKDGLGTRYRCDSTDGPLDVLVLHEAFARIPSFEFLIRERVNRLAHVRSEYFARVHDVEHVSEGSTVAVVSAAVPGVRLSRMLAVAEQNLLPLDVESALWLVHQILTAVAELHEDAPDACHGTLAAERVVLTSTGRIVIVEQVLGAALAQLRYSPERYWKDLRIALPIAVTSPLLDRRADVAQIGVIALGLLLGRPVAEDEYPEHIGALANGSFGLGGGFDAFPEWLRLWLSQALSLEPTRWFASAVEALHAFEAGMQGAEYTASPDKLRTFLRQQYARFDVIEPARAEAQPIPIAVAKVPVPVAVQPQPALAPTERPAPKRAATPAPTPSPARFIMPPASRQSRDEEAEMPQAYAAWGNTRETANHRPRLIAAAVVVIALTSGGVIAARRYLAAPEAPTPTTGTISVNTDPAGASLVIDGQARGTTPVTVTVNAGPHTIELSKDEVRRTVRVNVTANTQVSQFVEMPKAPADTGDLLVRTDPAGARISVDGEARGISPLTIPGLAPGSHVVVLENDLGSVREDVNIQAGATASLVVPLKAPQGAPVSGWISIAVPADVQIYEDGRLLGSSRLERIMVAAGRHNLEFVNDTLGYRSSQAVQVAPGQVARVRPDWPQGTIAINATPWATVTLDGQELGETPVGNTRVPIGTHEVVFRHPQLGEQRQTATVTATTPARVSVDMRKK